MNNFNRYAEYYDLLYRDKDYGAEAVFVRNLIKKHYPEAQILLEIGCGTGRHAQLLASDGFVLHGVDTSEEMLQAARKQQAQQHPIIQKRLSFGFGNASSFRGKTTFDVVLSLFHVVSYQISNEALGAMFRTAFENLKPGGIFIFDFWYGPAVISNRPVVRVKRMESEDVAVTRIAEPSWEVGEGVVEVNYDVFVRRKVSNVLENFQERHRMRYLTLPEIDLLAKQAGLHLLETFEWLSGRAPGLDSWSVGAVLRK